MTQKHFKKHSLLFRSLVMITLGFHGGSDGKESTCNARDLCSIPGLGISPGEGNGNRSSILAWEIPWTEEPGSLQPMGLQRVRYNRMTIIHSLNDHIICSSFPHLPFLSQHHLTHLKYLQVNWGITCSSSLCCNRGLQCLELKTICPGSSLHFPLDVGSFILYQ